MKIKQAHIDGFGKWHDQEFTFSDNPQLIYGPNEAGKTTLMMFLISILFGFTDGRGKNRFAQYIPKETSSYGGSLLIEIKGRDYRIKRQKGKNGGRVTVTDEQGHVGGEKELQKLLGPIDRSLYQSLFSFGQRDLAMVDEVNRARWQQHLQQIGAVGSNRWAQLVNDFQTHADKIYKPRGRKWPLDQDLRQHELITEKINKSREKYDEYQNLQEQLKKLQEQLPAKQASLKKLDDKLERLTHLHQVWPVYVGWQKNHQIKEETDNSLNDEQITAVQRLQVKEKELSRQQQNYQQRLAILDKHPGAQIKSHELLKGQELKQQVVKLQAQAEVLHDQRLQENEWQSELATLQAQYHHSLPAPLSRADRQQLANILQNDSQQRNSQSFELSKESIVGIVIGFMLFIIGLLLNKGFITAVGAIITFAIAIVKYRQQGENTNWKSNKGSKSQELNRFGKAHGLQVFPVNQWLLMQSDLQRGVELSDKISRLNKDKQKFDYQFTTLKRQLPSSITGITLTEINQQLDQLIKKNQEDSQEHQAVTREQAMIANTLAQLNQEYGQVHRQKMMIYQQFGIVSDAQFESYLISRANAQTMAVKSDAYEKQLTNADRIALSQYHSDEELTNEIEKTRQQISQLKLDISDNQTTQQKKLITIKSLVADGTLSSLEQERANLETKIWNEIQEWLTYQLAIEWVNKTLMAASSDRYPTIIGCAEQYFEILTANKYNQINITTNGLQVIRQDHEVFQVEELSQGTAEQLYVALRLGFVAVMSDQVNLPVIIDDGFVNFDNDRREKMLKLLLKIAEKNQVLYFTADDRIKRFPQKVLDLQQFNRE